MLEEIRSDSSSHREPPLEAWRFDLLGRPELGEGSHRVENRIETATLAATPGSRLRLLAATASDCRVARLLAIT
jgi:hypothetical protein